MSIKTNYGIIDPMLARMAIKDLGISQDDLDRLRKLVGAGGDEDGIRDYVRRTLPGWEARPDALALLVRVLASGEELEA